MKTNFENIKTKASEFFKTDKAKIGGACVCALLICVGVGFGGKRYCNSKRSKFAL